MAHDQSLVKDSKQYLSLSSDEAELIGMVKLSTELLGLMSLARDLDCRLHGRVWADSSAALAVVKNEAGQASCGTST